ncbi:hypothetical protein GLOIN_2v1507787 [Rhizophagus irregularis DAOM 181602=DAOM 197198]|uniref:Uncharacterized protein n=1 Tax=Rhizophagus irregularis (strain DAOM 181602 / DAOM 197198 / MUCL 43194) TaxID=747089 RepID=A0A2P4QUT9_RHIID|nr:hypothetical protein GLOIN_2v1507787 [Rhizophagus irregularis DAOM 181602=DAOM 197198]POG81423.1 hypothetical protein GLOIN_2v1507787 [Rhizophagus irregularis DAOM 181602=DAOM 197198]|eukprot:XP_025188289.1 hypothetical protein GLOIN_2v1507787 [Rhizophagus irregularis DAOM 181602=DAOM 197198]
MITWKNVQVFTQRKSNCDVLNVAPRINERKDPFIIKPLYLLRLIGTLRRLLFLAFAINRIDTMIVTVSLFYNLNDLTTTLSLNGLFLLHQIIYMRVVGRHLYRTVMIDSLFIL